MQQLITDADLFVSNVISRRSLQPITTNINLKNDEYALLECDSTLREAKSVRYYQSGHAGVRIAKGIYIGKTSGSSESQDEFRNIDAGSLILTNKRLVFHGSTNSRNLQLSKIISVESFGNSISVSSETRQKVMSYTVSNSLIWEFMIKMTLGVADPLNLSELEIGLITEKDTLIETENHKQQKDNHSCKEISSGSDQRSLENEVIHKPREKWESSIQPKYSDNRERLKNSFKSGYDFLKTLENNKHDIWIGTATNAHLYLRNNYLAYIIIKNNRLIFRAKFNNQIYTSTIDKSRHLFSDKFKALIISHNGFKQGWAVEKGQVITFTNSTPGNFFTDLLEYIISLEI